MKHTIIKRLFRKSNKNDMTLGCYILLCIALTTETTTVPTIGDSVKSTSDKHDVSPVPVLMKTPALDAKLRPKQPLDTHHVLLKELFKTATNLLTGNKLKQELSGNSLVSDLNVINLPDLLLDINPSTYEKSIIKGKCSYFKTCKAYVSSNMLRLVTVIVSIKLLERLKMLLIYSNLFLFESRQDGSYMSERQWIAVQSDASLCYSQLL